MWVVRLEKEEDKMKILENKYKLKKDTGTEGIYINNDLTKQEREIQRQLRKMVKEEREKGRCKIIMNGDHVLIYSLSLIHIWLP